MPHLVRWYDELGDFGLLVLGVHAQRATEEQIKAKARALGINFPVIDGGAVEGANDFRAIPHCILFDHTGKCLYRGSPEKVEAKLRPAVGQAILAVTEKSTYSRSLKPLADSLRRGQSPASVLQKAVPLLRSADAATAGEAKLLVSQLTAQGQKQLEQAEAARADDPVAAYAALKRLPAVFKGTDVAARATRLLGDLKKDKGVQAELQAQPTLESVRKLDTQLGPLLDQRGGDPAAAEFKKAAAVPLKQLKAAVQKLKKSWPQTKATQEAVQLTEKYGVSVP